MPSRLAGQPNMALLRIRGVCVAALLMIADPAHGHLAGADDLVPERTVVLDRSNAIFTHAMSVSGSPGTMRISAATAGIGLTPITDATTMYSITTDDPDALKIMARISSGASMPDNTLLTLTLAAPGGGGTSEGSKPLTTSDQDFVTGITAQIASGRTITYGFSATVAAAPFSSTPRTVTFTIVAQ